MPSLEELQTSQPVGGEGTASSTPVERPLHYHELGIRRAAGAVLHFFDGAVDFAIDHGLGQLPAKAELPDHNRTLHDVMH